MKRPKNMAARVDELEALALAADMQANPVVLSPEVDALVERAIAVSRGEVDVFGLPPLPGGLPENIREVDLSDEALADLSPDVRRVYRDVMERSIDPKEWGAPDGKPTFDAS